MPCVCHTTPTQKLFCLHVFRQAGPPPPDIVLIGPKIGSSIKCVSRQKVPSAPRPQALNIFEEVFGGTEPKKKKFGGTELKKPQSLENPGLSTFNFSCPTACDFWGIV